MERGKMQQYRKEHGIKKLKLTIFILLLAGVVLLILDYPNIKLHLLGPTEFASLSPDEVEGGLLVEVSIDINFGTYASNEQSTYYSNYFSTTKTTDLYYVIWTGDAYAEDYRYMGIKVPVSEQSVMDEIAEAVSEGKHADSVKYVGIINRMSSEEYPMFEAYFEEAGWTKEEIEERTLPYTINVSYMEEQDHSDLYWTMPIFVVPVIIVLWCRKWED
ncbi:MAG: hypothetical protein K2H52_08960 [Lachnospiraceae bacterium]|nr:hypothetical protein [Lachnospiraceae bacterium]MDE6186032.1 hypothetical protein [Lachnospiraceae bacterium]MDE7287592.1 hypothetical protein [Lachnospiraceae bacterium]